MTPLQLFHPESKPSCGECTACCTAMAVLSIGKKLWQKCRFENGACSIYSDKPHECNIFECAWLSGHLVGDIPYADLRPDRLGLMFYGADISDGTPGLACWEVNPGAVLANAAMLEAIGKTHVIYIFPHGEPTKRMVLAPEHIAREGIAFNERSS